VAIAVAVIKVMQHFRRASDDFSQLAAEGKQWIHQLKDVTHDAGEVIDTFRDVAPRVRRVVERFETIGERTADVSDALLREVETPIRTAVAVARGVRFGARRFIERLSERFTGRSSTNGGMNYE
jgi:ABC-type transporter Mla subunit MlaD